MDCMPAPSCPAPDGQSTPAQPFHRHQLSTPPSPPSNLPIAAAAAAAAGPPAALPASLNPAATPFQAHDWPLSTAPATPTEHHSPLRQMPLTGDADACPVPHDSSQQGRAGAWYTRRSRPVTADAGPTSAKVHNMPSALATSASASPARPKLSSPATPSRFPLFASSISALRGFTSSPAALPHDELISLDIEAALCSSATQAEGDAPPSPAAFRNLHSNAAGLLRRFQAAYQQRSLAHDELMAEREAQDDERSEMETRTRHLKMQLEGMTQKASENEAIMKALMEELSKEKKLRMDYQQAREQHSICSNRSTVSEDLCAEEDQQRSDRRRSGETAKSDLSSDTDEESAEEASVFSRCRSPTLTVGTLDTAPAGSMSPPPAPPRHARPTMVEAPRRAQRLPQPQMSTFQKLFKGMSSEAPRDDDPRSVYSCRNCQGQDASVAWDTASLLRDENRGLKQRVGELEAAVEEALNAVIGIGL